MASPRRCKRAKVRIGPRVIGVTNITKRGCDRREEAKRLEGRAYDDRAHVRRGELPVLANELCHERAGRHTCDKRLSKAALAAAFPAVSYELIETEEDPYWGDGVTRESWEALARRGVCFVDWLLARRETATLS
mgnify:CR=1 FL=1